MDLDRRGRSLLVVKLLLNDTALLGSRMATNQRGIAIKVPGNLLQGRVLGLNVEEVDKDEFGGEPNALFQRQHAACLLQEPTVELT